MGRILTLSLAAAILFSSAALAADPAAPRAFHKEGWQGKEIPFPQETRTQIHWTVNFRDFLDEQTAQLKLEIEKFKPVRFVREMPLSTALRDTVQMEPVHYPSVQFSAARW